MTDNKIDVPSIIFSRIDSKNDAIKHLREQSLMVKRFWILGLSGVFIYFINPLLFNKVPDIDKLTVVSRALLASIAITSLFWIVDAVTWYFQRGLRNTVEDYELRLFQYTYKKWQHSDLSDFDYLVRKDIIDDNLLSLKRPTHLSALFNKSHLMYLGVITIFLIAINLGCLFIMNPSYNIIRIIIILSGYSIFFLVFYLWYKLFSAINDEGKIKYKKRLSFILFIALIASFINLLLLFSRIEDPWIIILTSVTIILFLIPQKKVIGGRKTFLFSTFEMAINLIRLSLKKITEEYFFKVLDEYSEPSNIWTVLGVWYTMVVVLPLEFLFSVRTTFESQVILIFSVLISLILIICWIIRINKMIRTNLEREEYMVNEEYKHKIFVIYKLNDEALPLCVLRNFKNKMEFYGNARVFIDYFDNKNEDPFNNWEDIANEEIRASDFIIKINSELESSNIDKELFFVKNYQKTLFKISAADAHYISKIHDGREFDKFLLEKNILTRNPAKLRPNENGE